MLNYIKKVMQYSKKEKLIFKNQNIFKRSSMISHNINDNNLVNLEQHLINEARFYPASNKEWLTSSYSYNKTTFKSLPIKDKLLYNLLKSYFNLKQNRVKDLSINANINIKNYSLSSFSKKRLKNKKLSLLLVKANNLAETLYLLKQWKNNLNTVNVKPNKELLADSEIKNKTNNFETSPLSLNKISKNNKRYLLIIKRRLLKKIRLQEKKKKVFFKKTYLSLPEIKHLNNKSIITVSIYNRNNQILKKKICKLYKMFILKKKSKILTVNQFNSYKNIELVSKQNKAGLLSLASLKKNLFWKLNKQQKNTVNNSYKLYLYKKIYIFFKIKSEAGLASPNLLNLNLNLLFLASPAHLISDVKLALKKINLRKLKKIQKILQKKYKKLIKYKYLIMLLCIYRFRLNNNNLLGLKNITRKIYGKKIVFRIINLKYMYLDSNIMAEAITKKLRDRKKKIIRVLKKIMENIKKVTLVKNLWQANSAKPASSNRGQNNLHNVLLNNTNKKLYSKTAITNLIDNEYLLDKSDEKQKKELNGLILYNLKHKMISGIKVQGAGRLTKRLTASRSITKSRSKGSLKNINSSRDGVTNVMVRGYLKSNLQYVNINSYNRNGSFGVKSWISSY